MEGNFLVLNVSKDQRFIATPATPVYAHNICEPISECNDTVQDGLFTVAEHEMEPAQNGMEWWSEVSIETVRFFAIPYYNRTLPIESLTKELFKHMVDSSIFPDWISEAHATILLSAANDNATTIYVLLDDIFLDEALSWSKYAASITKEVYNGGLDPVKIVMVTCDPQVKKDDWPGCDFVVLCPLK